MRYLGIALQISNLRSEWRPPDRWRSWPPLWPQAAGPSACGCTKIPHHKARAKPARSVSWSERRCRTPLRPAPPLWPLACGHASAMKFISNQSSAT